MLSNSIPSRSLLEKNKTESLLLIPCPWLVILTVMNSEVSAPKAWLLLSINTDYMENNSEDLGLDGQYDKYFDFPPFFH